MDLKEYDGTRPLDLRPRYSETQEKMPPMATPPGTCDSEFRAMKQLALWMVAPTSMFLVGAYAFCLLPLGCFSFPIMPIMVGMMGAAVPSLLVQNRAGMGVVSLPVRSESVTRVLWFVTVVNFPLVYGIAQLPIRLMIAASEGIATSRTYLLLPDCILAMGIGAAAFLSRPLWHRSPQDENAVRPQYRYSLKGMILMAVYLSVMPLIMPSVYRYEGGEPSFVYGGAVVIAIALTAISYWIATRTVSNDWLIPQQAEIQTSVSLPWMKRYGPGAASFLDLWLTQLQMWSICVMVMMAIIWPLSVVQGGGHSDGDAFTFYIPFAIGAVPLMLFLPQLNDFDYRIIRSLPLRRWQQVILVFSLALPQIIPVSVALLVATPFAEWPLAHFAAFLIAYTGCCVFLISLNATLKSGGTLGGLLLSLPIFIILGFWHSPWALGIYGGYAVFFWGVAYVNLYRELYGDGSLYNKTDDFTDMMLGRR